MVRRGEGRGGQGGEPAMTKPTRGQRQACDRLAEAVLLIAEAARLDGRSPFGPADLAETVDRLARAVSAFEADTIVALALERRGAALGLRSGTAELIGLVGGEAAPLEMLLRPDEGFRAAVAALEEELGEL